MYNNKEVHGQMATATFRDWCRYHK